MKIIKIKGRTATVQSDHHTHKVDLSLIKDVKVGDYILAHADLAINKIEAQEAENILEAIKNFNNHEHK